MKAFILSPTCVESIKISSSDKRIKKIISDIGEFKIPLIKNEYLSLIKFIIGQQLSEKAANTIYQRLCASVKSCSPEVLLETNDERFKTAGVSKMKTSFIKDLSSKIIDREIDFKKLRKYDNESVIKKLTEIKGIGQWTAEMFLIFTLGRLDVISLNDVGLQRSIKWLYRLHDNPNKEIIIKISNKWKPYRSIASLYLWELINRNIINSGSFRNVG